MKNLTWQNPEQLFVAQELINKVKSKCCGIKVQKYGKAVTCVCFMGGDAEPFEVERLAGFLHRQSIALVKVGWYSGKNELPEGLSVQNFEYIKLGPYIEKLGGLKSPDTNQHFYRIYGDEMKDITYRFWRI